MKTGLFLMAFCCMHLAAMGPDSAEEESLVAHNAQETPQENLRKNAQRTSVDIVYMQGESSCSQAVRCPQVFCHHVTCSACGAYVSEDFDRELGSEAVVPGPSSSLCCGLLCFCAVSGCAYCQLEARKAFATVRQPYAFVAAPTQPLTRVKM